MEKLEPCPFCGSDASIVSCSTAAEKVPRYRVHCSQCWCMTDWDNFTENEAIEKWNRRAGHV